MKEGERISQRTDCMCIRHGHKQQCGDGLRKGRVRSGWRWAKGEKIGVSVIV